MNNLTRYYEEVLATMGTPGWAFLMEDMTALRDQLTDVRRIKDMGALKFQQGELSILDLIISRQATTRQAFDELERQGALEGSDEEDV